MTSLPVALIVFFGFEFRCRFLGRADRGDAVLLNCDRAVFDDPAFRVHCDDPVRVLDENSRRLSHVLPLPT